jgi:hypothetical protein
MPSTSRSSARHEDGSLGHETEWHDGLVEFRADEFEIEFRGTEPLIYWEGASQATLTAPA